MSAFIHPSILRLFLMQSLAHWRRFGRSFVTPRRFVLSSVGLLLGIFYLGNVVLSVCLREPMNDERFRAIVPFGLMAYVLWDLVKTACRRPEEGLGWSRAERERLHAAPFTRRNILAYRFAGILLAATAKALLFSIVLFVDIPIYLCGVCGALLALIFVDLLRMTISITAFGLSPAAYRWCRSIILAIAGAVVLSAALSAWNEIGANANAASGSIKMIVGIGGALMAMGQTVPGQVLMTPFTVYSHVLTADRLSLSLMAHLVAGMLMAASAAWLVVRLDEYFETAKKFRERRQFARAKSVQPRNARQATKTASLQIRARSGLAILVWRQLLGAKRYWGSLLISLIPPAVLSCFPLIVNRRSDAAFYAVVGSLAFYSFVLLPAALKFDFRRDFYRMCVLKSLPIKPFTIVLGQLACPVLVTSFFQLVVIGVATVLTVSSVGYYVAAVLVLLPLNVLIFALENVIFLLYPHPMKQEGFETFLRTTLTFTAKGLLFGAALGIVVGWAYIAGFVARHMLWDARPFFAAGLGMLITAAAVFSVYATVRAYCRFDPCQDSVVV
jgi:hypothetical protein